jgi:hypothetical protein
MKQFYFALLCIFGFAGISSARQLTAVNSGDFNTSSTWSPVSTPASGDTLNIPSGKTVSVNNNISLSASTIIMRIGGELQLVGGGAKLSLNDRSAIYIYSGGDIKTNHMSQEIVIGTNTVLQGTNTAAYVYGPVMANSTSSSSSSALASSTTSSGTGFVPYNFTTLPVTFLSFMATRQQSSVLVQWATATEQNAARFEVEMSQNGSTWSTAGAVTAAGNSNTTHTYSFTVNNAPAGNLQFRIRQVDVDGKFTLTAIRQVKAATEAGSVKVTATAGRVVLQFGQEVKGATVRILNLNGQVLQEQKLSSSFGQVLIPTSQKGLCLVAVVTENEVAAAQKVML